MDAQDDWTFLTATTTRPITNRRRMMRFMVLERSQLARQVVAVPGSIGGINCCSRAIRSG